MSSNLATILDKLKCLRSEIIESKLLPEEYGKIVQEISSIHLQTKAQHSLQITTNLLHPTKKAEFLQRGERIKRIIHFIFNDSRPKPEKAKARTSARCERLRKLDCDSLKLVALSYTAAELFDLEEDEFDHLIELVPGFISRHGMADLLYRHDINKAASAPPVCLIAPAPALNEWYKNFLRTHCSRVKESKVQVRPSPLLGPANRVEENEPSSVIAATPSSREIYGAFSGPNDHGPWQDRCSSRKRTPGESCLPALDAPNSKRKRIDVGPGEVFFVSLADARWAINHDQGVTGIYMTCPETSERKESFLSVWVDEPLANGLRGRCKLLL